jgi:hypothetical protein
MSIPYLAIRLEFVETGSGYLVVDVRLRFRMEEVGDDEDEAVVGLGRRPT